MSEISQADLRQQVANQRAIQGTRNYEIDEQNRFVPTPNNVPAPSNPNRRPATPQPTGPSPFGIITGAVDDACNIRRLVGPGAWRNSTLPTAALSALSPSWRNSFDSAWDRLCGDSPAYNPPPSPTVPYQGGQCSGVRYNVQVFGQRFTFSNNTCNQTSWNSQIAQFWGPIAGTRINYTANGGGAVEVLCRGPGAQAIRPSVAWIGFTSVTNSSSCDRATITNTVISRVDGQPDNCGNPEPQYPDSGQRAPTPPPLTIDLGGNNVSIQPSFTFNPETGDINIDLGPDLNVSFDGANFNFPGGDGGGTPGATPVRPSPDDSTTDPEEPPPLPPQDEDLEEPPEPPAEVIRAALVTVTAISEYQTAINGASPDPDNFFPDLGTIKFRISADDTNSGFTNPIRVQNQRAFIPCPWDGGAFAVVGTPRPGVEWTITPIYDISGLPQP